MSDIATRLGTTTTGQILVRSGIEIDRILRSCGCRWMLAGGPTLEMLSQLATGESAAADVSIAWMGEAREVEGRLAVALTREDFRRQPSVPLGHRRRPEDPAHRHSR